MHTHKVAHVYITTHKCMCLHTQLHLHKGLEFIYACMHTKPHLYIHTTHILVHNHSQAQGADTQIRHIHTQVLRQAQTVHTEAPAENTCTQLKWYINPHTLHSPNTFLPREGWAVVKPSFQRQDLHWFCAKIPNTYDQQDKNTLNTPKLDSQSVVYLVT